MPASKRAPLHCLIALAATLLALVPASRASARAERYIVILEPGADSKQIANEHARRHGANVKFVYGETVRGYAARIPTARIRAVRNDFRVAYVEHDGPVTAQAQVLPRGIKRIGADRSFTKAGNGSRAISNVRAYVIDTGIDTGHADLNVVRHVNFAGGPNRDCNGHGTHVAGTVAARDNSLDVVGVAPAAPLTGVKVLGCGGGGTISGVIKGVDWVTANAKKPAVANLSLGGGTSQALDDAVKRSANSGIFYAIAAGNSGADACTSSPARVPALTTG